MKPNFRRLTTIALPVLMSAGFIHTAFAAEESAEVKESKAKAHETWLSEISASAKSTEGCFHAAYPSVQLERIACKAVTHPLVHPTHAHPSAGAAEITGNGNDYVAKAPGLITKTRGSFPTVTGVTSESSVGVAAFGGGGILGSNEYSLQINTNFNSTTSACASHSGCTVWQQFIYATDYNSAGEGAAFIQYWLIGWGNSACPGSFGSDGGGDCYMNSPSATAPDVPITSLAKMTLAGDATPGGYDSVIFDSGTDTYVVTVKDNVLDIATVWKESEFNIVGDAGGSRADFNSGSSVSVKIALTDGSTAKPTCVANAGTTGETNNLTLGACTASSGPPTAIQFTEKN